MKELVATMTKRGQVTVPAEVRRLLGLRPNEKVAFAVEGQEVRLKAAAFTLDTIYQSVPPLKKPINDKKVARIAKEEKAERTVRKLQSR